MTTYTHAQVGIVDSEGNVNVIYPITVSDNISIDRNNINIPTSAKSFQTLADALGHLSFTNTQMNDEESSLSTTYTSSKIDEKLSNLTISINNINNLLSSVKSGLTDNNGNIIKLTNKLPFKLAIDPETGDYGYIKNGETTITPFAKGDITVIYIKDIGIQLPEYITINDIKLTEFDKSRIYNIIINSTLDIYREPVFDASSLSYNNISIQNLYESGELMTKIRKGDFTGLQIGNYFEITMNTSLLSNEKVRCVLSDFDNYYKTGKTNSLDYHHAVIIPWRSFFGSGPKMQDNYTTAWSYLESYAYTQWMPLYQSALESIFDQHLLSRKVYFSTKGGTSSGAGSEGAWFDTKLSLMGELEVFGIINGANTGSYNNDENQFRIFLLDPSFIGAQHTTGASGVSSTNQTYWLKDPHYSTSTNSGNFTCVSGAGKAAYSQANKTDAYLRPCWLIG